MPVVQVSSAANRDEYEAVAKFVDLAGDRPAGLILHAACELPGGEIQIIDVWESAEALQSFGQQRIFPAFAQAGILDKMRAVAPPMPLEPFDFVH